MKRVLKALRAHPVLSILGAVVLLVGGAAYWVYETQIRVPYVEVDFAVPGAPELAASGPEDRIFRIDASKSEISYEVEESLAGVSNTAVGTTQGVAGDIRIDEAEPANSEIGQIVVNVAQFTSDETLRDQRLQHDFLESQRHPLATFETTDIEGLPDDLSEGTEYEVTITGDLTVKEITDAVTLEGTARIDGDELELSAETELLMSTYDVGPISLIGFVRTDDEVILHFDIVAVDESEYREPSLVASPGEVATTGDGPSFADEVAPILEQSCATCHQPDGLGSHYWLLEEAGDAAEVASGLGLVVGSEFMPPWPATEEGIPLAHDRSLSDEDIATLVNWGEAGGPLDVDPETPVEPVERDVPELDRDMVLPMAEPYQGSMEVTNDYRCFVLDPELTETTWFSGYAFEPDVDEIVHHATAFRAPADTVGDLEAKDDADDRGPGWDCIAPEGGTSQFAAWAPGQDPTVFPEGSAMPFEPGDVMVVQIHYHYGHSAPPDQSQFVFDISDEDPDALDEVQFTVYLAPAEIPCPEGETAELCDRDAVLADLVDDYGPIAAGIPGALLAQCGFAVEDFAHMTDGTADASCDHRVRNPGELLAVFGHMHEIGKTFRMTLNPDTAEEKVLLDIDEWDFGWQLNYEPLEEIHLESGDTLRMECSWDRERAPLHEMRYITWAEGTEDEMCYSTVTTRADD